MKLFATALLALSAAFAAPVQATDIELWRLDCGQITVRDLSIFSDSFAYAGKTRTLTDSCYLIRTASDILASAIITSTIRGRLQALPGRPC